ncbi:hypothetical protein OH77DRAFT_216184 [Trametes cingulata]|nr:hypothetical protein OH77DRAFT_216184 [Trametes cingulata]
MKGCGLLLSSGARRPSVLCRSGSFRQLLLCPWDCSRTQRALHHRDERYSARLMDRVGPSASSTGQRDARVGQLLSVLMVSGPLVTTHSIRTLSRRMALVDIAPPYIWCEIGCKPELDSNVAMTQAHEYQMMALRRCR